MVVTWVSGKELMIWGHLARLSVHGYPARVMIPKTLLDHNANHGRELTTASRRFDFERSLGKNNQQQHNASP